MDKKVLKYLIKNKIKFTESLLIIFLITGSVAFSNEGINLEGKIEEYITEKNNTIDYGVINFLGVDLGLEHKNESFFKINVGDSE